MNILTESAIEEFVFDSLVRHSFLLLVEPIPKVILLGLTHLRCKIKHIRRCG